MADKAASILARLKNKAIEKGISYQLCLQLFCQEEFLRRVQKSAYADHLVLKGGLFIYTLTEFESRATVDIDFLLSNLTNTPEQLQILLEGIINVKTDCEFITYEIKNVVPISIGKKYTGISASLVAYIRKIRIPINIDFGVGDVIVPGQKMRKIPTQLSDFEAPFINTYSIETTIAEKLDAILTLMEFSSRMKDYYDLYYLANKFDLSGSLLCEAFTKTFENRHRAFTAAQFDQIMTYDINDSMQQKWKTFIKKTGLKSDAFEIVLKTINEFLYEPFCCSINNTNFDRVWSAERREWLM